MFLEDTDNRHIDIHTLQPSTYIGIICLHIYIGRKKGQEKQRYEKRIAMVGHGQSCDLFPPKSSQTLRYFRPNSDCGKTTSRYNSH